MKTLLSFLLLIAVPSLAQDEELQWKSIGATLIQGKVYHLFEAQDGSQMGVKGRTEPSKNPEEKPTPENLPNRQALFEIGLATGIEHASSEAMSFTRDGRTGRLSDFYQGKGARERPRGQAVDVQILFHPPVQKLSRVTVGGSLVFMGTEDAGYDGATVMNARGIPMHNWTLSADYDMFYFPGKYGTGAFATGYYWGRREPGAFINRGYIANWDKGGNKTDQGLELRYRHMFDSVGGETVSKMSAFTTFRYATDGTVRWTVGFGMGFGPKNAPKYVPQK